MNKRRTKKAWTKFFRGRKLTAAEQVVIRRELQRRSCDPDPLTSLMGWRDTLIYILADSVTYTVLGISETLQRLAEHWSNLPEEIQKLIIEQTHKDLDTAKM